MEKSSETVVRPVEKSELKELLELARNTFTESFASQNTKSNFDQYVSKSFTMQKIEKEFSNSESKFYVVNGDTKPIAYLKVNVGLAQTENKLDQSLEIERIYVSADHQGKRIGQLLLQKAMDLAKEFQLNWVWLGVWDQNVNAIRFYERHGFVKFATHPFKLGDENQTDILMKKEL